MRQLVESDPWWHTLLEVAGGAAAALTVLSIVVMLGIRYRKWSLMRPIEAGDKDVEVRLSAAIKDMGTKIMTMIGANGESLVAVNARNIRETQQQLSDTRRDVVNALHDLKRMVAQQEARHRSDLDAIRASEAIHRQQGYAISKIQYDVAKRHGLVGWPDPDAFHGMFDQVADAHEDGYDEG